MQTITALSDFLAQLLAACDITYEAQSNYGRLLTANNIIAFREMRAYPPSSPRGVVTVAVDLTVAGTVT